MTVLTYLDPSDSPSRSCVVLASYSDRRPRYSSIAPASIWKRSPAVSSRYETTPCRSKRNSRRSRERSPRSKTQFKTVDEPSRGNSRQAGSS